MSNDNDSIILKGKKLLCFRCWGPQWRQWETLGSGTSGQHYQCCRYCDCLHHSTDQV